jgi:hypothetical protein
METKICTKCGKELSLSEFYKCKRNKDGLTSQCKSCMNNSKTKHTHICKFCGKKFTNVHKNAKYCSDECSIKSQTKSQEQFINELSKVNPNVEVLSDYKGGKHPIKCRCKIHNKIYETTPQVLLRGCGCDECSSEKISDKKRKEHDIFVFEMKHIHPNIKILGKYEGNNKSVKCRCKTCGCEWNPNPHDLLQGHGCPSCGIKSRSGENHPKWNPNLSQKDREDNRKIEGYAEWRDQVYKKDNHTCQCCGDDRGGNLNAHHLDGYNWCIEGRTDVNNGITLCDTCHKEFHSIYGYGDNTKEQYEEFINNRNKEVS